MNSRTPLTTAAIIAAVFVAAPGANASVITDSSVLNIDDNTNIFRDFRGDSSTRASGDRLALSIKVSDAANPGMPPPGDTLVIVKQIADSSDPTSETGREAVVGPSFSPAIPNEFGRSLPWIDEFAGSAYKIIAKNPPDNDADKEVRVTVNNTIPAGDPLPLATDITLSGDGTLAWKIPPTDVAYNQYRVVVIRESDRKLFVLGARNPIAHNPAGQSVQLNVLTDPAFAGKLNENEPYELRIETISVDPTRDISRQYSRSSTFVNFTVLPDTTPTVFLPTLDPGGVFNFDFEVVEGETVGLDPLVAIGYEYAIGAVGDPLFASVMIPDDLTQSGSYTLTANGTDHALIAGQVFNFLDLDPDGIAAFSILGIDPSYMLDPTDTTAFLTNVSFASSGRFTGTMTPITTLVPVPPSVALFLLGLTGLRLARRAAPA